jgi:hypothetical protein
MRRQSKAEKLIDLRIDLAYRKTCSGIQINMLDIPKVFAFGRIKIMEGEDDAALCNSIRAYVESIRVDK